VKCCDAVLFDSHAHIFPEQVVDRAMEALSKRYGAQPVARATVDGLLRHMDDSGVGSALVLGVATKPSQVSAINAFLTSLGQPRLVPFGSLHPHSSDLAGDIRRLTDAGVRGVKLQPHFQDYGLADPGLHEMLDLIGDRLVVLIHGGDEIIAIPRIEPSPERLLELHRRHPDVRLIIAHLGGYKQWDEVERCLVGEDVLLDASYVFDICSDEQARRIIRTHGVDRVVWGSDFPWQPQRQGLSGIARLGFSEAETRQLLGENLRRLLGME